MRIQLSRSGIMVAAGALLAIGGMSWSRADERETLQRAAEQSVEKITPALAQTSFKGVKNVAVVPLRGDMDGYITERVRDSVTHTPYSLFTRSDSAWDLLLKEIEWGAKREDIMNPETIKKFGRIEGVDAILYGIVWDDTVSLWSIRGHVKMSLILADVETGQELWRSGPLEGEAYMHWSDAITQFWRYPLLLLGGIFGLGVLAVVVWRVRRVFRPL